MKLLLALLLSQPLWAIDLKKIKYQQWNHLDVVWIEDNSVPTFSVQVYFADGALSDAPGRAGETDYTFSGLLWGSNRFTQKEISDNLEYFGVQHNIQVFHEYSTFSYHGLNKDLIPVTKKYCHLFADSIYPKSEVKKHIQRTKSSLTNLVTDHSKLAERVFRRLSLRGTAFELPIAGTLRSINRINTNHLKRKRRYFSRQVKKKLYLRGNRKLLNIKDIILGECGWGTESEAFSRQITQKQKAKKLRTRIVLIPVKEANQAQIRIGRFLTISDIQNPELLNLMSAYIGGNFLSVLNQELRTKRGLVYSVNAFAQGQKYYGRSAIMTFSRNEKVKETITVIRDALEKIQLGKIDPNALKKTANFLKGGHLFQFESYNSFLRTLMFFDHAGKRWDDLYHYPQIIDRFTAQDVAANAMKIFNWNNLLIVVVGNKTLLKDLKANDSTQILNYQNYL